MASITSVISLLLLFAYCYSTPVQERFEGSKPIFKFTTGETMIDHDNKTNMHLVKGNESTGVPTMHQQRSFDKFTTPSLLEHPEEKVHPLRTSGLDDKLTLDDKVSLNDTTELKVQHGIVLNMQDNAQLWGKYVFIINVVDTYESLESIDKRAIALNMDDKHELNGKVTLHDKRESLDDKVSVNCTTMSKDQQGIQIHVEPNAQFKSQNISIVNAGDKCELLKSKDKRVAVVIADDTHELHDKVSWDDKRGMDDYLFTTMDTRTTFQERAIKPVDSSEMVSNVRPMSSVDSFGKTTGLLNDQSEKTIDEPRTLTNVEHTSKTVVHPPVVKKPKVVKV